MCFSKVNIIPPFFEKKVNKTIEGSFVVGRYLNPTPQVLVAHLQVVQVRRSMRGLESSHTRKACQYLGNFP